MSNDKKVSFSPSQLRAMNEEQISSLFHSSNWDRIDTNTKLGLCQEVENRLAEQDGVEARTVIAEKMNGLLYGEQRGDIIAINADMLNDGVFCTTYINENGNVVTSIHSIDAPNWNTYDTIAHEHSHGVSLDKDQMPYTYISPKTDYDLYRIQDEERIAFSKGNNMTRETIFKAEIAMNKEDYQKEDYLESIANDSYEKSLESAKIKYNDPFIDKTLATFINDRDNGIRRENASPSYEQIEAIYNEQLQRQLTEIMQSKEQFTQQDIENSVTKFQDETQGQITKVTAKENEQVKNSTVSEKTAKNDAELVTNEEIAETVNDCSISLDIKSSAEISNDNIVSLDDGTYANTSNDDKSMNEIEGVYEQDDLEMQNDGSISLSDDDEMSLSDDGEMSLSDDGEMSLSDDGEMSLDN